MKRNTSEIHSTYAVFWTKISMFHTYLAYISSSVGISVGRLVPFHFYFRYFDVSSPQQSSDQQHSTVGSSCYNSFDS
jgi:hypothetical protein